MGFCLIWNDRWGRRGDRELGLCGVDKAVIFSSLGLGHGMAMSLQSLEPGSVGAWLAVPQTQRVTQIVRSISSVESP